MMSPLTSVWDVTAQEGPEACVCIVLVTWEVEAGGFFEFSIF